MTIPGPVWETVPETAIDNILPHVPANVIESTAADETLVATPGPDLFLFDASTLEGNDTIVGYDPDMDRIEIHNVMGFSWYGDEEGFDISFTGLMDEAPFVATSSFSISDLTFAELDAGDSILIDVTWSTEDFIV